MKVELGISTFVETTPDVVTGETISHAERLREVVEEIVLAEQVGLDVYGVGEHHRHDYAASSPAVVLAAGAALTTKIRLTSAVMILSSADPVRVFQDFATLDGISNGYCYWSKRFSNLRLQIGRFLVLGPHADVCRVLLYKQQTVHFGQVLLYIR